MIKIQVSTSKKYDVIMSKGILSNAGAYIKDALNLKETLSQKKICIVTDINVNSLYGADDQPLIKSLQASGFKVYKHIFPGGEQHKTLQVVEDILEFLAENKFTRSDILLAFGGGITGDITGFAAASYLRGIDYIQVPTTLLATVDSSVGGKTGVNLKSGKNLAGAFWQPSLVLFDPDVLSTLSHSQKLDGIAEAIKAGIIGDTKIIEAINKCHDLKDQYFLTELAALAIKVKKEIVEKDEEEKGCRQLLNLGHTIGHAIEKCSNYQISHGHAVAMGMAIVSKASDALNWSEKPCSKEIIGMLNAFDFPLNCPYTAGQLTEVALNDKKIRGEEITLVIPSRIGKCLLKTIPLTDLASFIIAGMKG